MGKIRILNLEGDVISSCKVPDVLETPIRKDVVEFVFKNVNKNKRQPYAVKATAGIETSSESWGTGRSVSRVPRVSGSGSHRMSQGSVANMCRGGHMFAPTKVWRKWHVKTNKDLKRLAVASAVAASAVSGLVLARGHRIENVSSVPLVVSNDVESVTKTSKALQFLKAVNAYDDILRVKESKKLRCGIGKIRNRRYRSRRGPLIIYNEDKGLVRAFRGIPGVELNSVNALNILKLAPGGHVGRFVIWTESAFKLLNTIFGKVDTPSEVKSGFQLPHPMMNVVDLPRLLRSDEIQSALRPAGPSQTKRSVTQRKNPLRNRAVMVRLNPYSRIQIRNEVLAQEKAESMSPEERVALKKKKKSQLSAHKKTPFAKLILSSE